MSQNPTNPQHCAGYANFKSLKSFTCTCQACGAEKEIFSDEFDKSKPSLTTSGGDTSRTLAPTVPQTPLMAQSAETESLQFGTIFQQSLKNETDSSVVNRVKFLGLMHELEPSFRRFKRTNSFVVLFTMLKTWMEPALKLSGGSAAAAAGGARGHVLTDDEVIQRLHTHFRTLQQDIAHRAQPAPRNNAEEWKRVTQLAVETLLTWPFRQEAFRVGHAARWPMQRSAPAAAGTAPMPAGTGPCPAGDPSTRRTHMTCSLADPPAHQVP